MHAPFRKAIEDDPELKHAVIVHDPFHIMKRANEALSELRRVTFFRAGPELRAVGRGTSWLVLKAWEKTSDEEKATLRQLFSYNTKLARAYQVVDELRVVLRAPDDTTMAKGMWHVLCRTARRDNVPMRRLHDSLAAHMLGILALGAHRPPTGRIEALNNNGRPWYVAPEAIEITCICLPSCASSPQTQSRTKRASVASLRSA